MTEKDDPRSEIVHINNLKDRIYFMPTEPPAAKKNAAKKRKGEKTGK